MKKEEFKGMSVDELASKALELKDDLKKQKFGHSISPLENANVIKTTRKNIARVLTELNSKKQQA